jgi:hypothetical protein
LHSTEDVSVQARREQLLAVAVVCMSAVACSSGSTPPAGSSSTPTSTPSVASAKGYLDAVNALCDALLPKVVAVTNGGSFDIPLKDFFAQLPAHTKLRVDFDRQLAKIPVPPAAKDKAAVLDAYIRFANELDARRLAAAKQGAAAYTKEIAAEADAGNDPTIAARDAAGFHESCNAR